jgi:putative selenate reductase FAD-binding subunit
MSDFSNFITERESFMILAYHRPDTLAEALKLISRSKPKTLPLGGGTLLSRPTQESYEVVDLQSLGLQTIQKKGKDLEIGATTTLQKLLESSLTPTALKDALTLEAPLNMRNSGTVAGTLVTADGRSTLVTVLLALDAKVIIQPDDEQIQIGDFLPIRKTGLHGKLITHITIPLNVDIKFESLARTPSDKPIVCVALASWPSKRTRQALGGYGEAPILAMDGTEPEGIESAARNAFQEAADDWASAEYRMATAAILAHRLLSTIHH